MRSYRSRLSRWFAVALMLLWLPLQGVAAVAMPFCQHSTSPHDTASDAHHAAAAAVHSADHRDHQHAHAAGKSCRDCGACNLACSPTALPSQRTLVRLGTEVYAPVAQAIPPLLDLEQRTPPPLA